MRPAQFSPRTDLSRVCHPPHPLATLAPERGELSTSSSARRSTAQRVERGLDGRGRRAGDAKRGGTHLQAGLELFGSKGWDQNFAAALQQGRENRWVNVSYASTEIFLPPENPTLLAVWTSPA
jgi:hypothetical protein